MLKYLFVILLIFSFSTEIFGFEKLTNRNSTNPLEMAIERALEKLLIDLPDSAGIVIREVEAPDHGMETEIYEFFEHILAEIGFFILDRNSHKYVRNVFYNRDEHVEFYIITTKATDKQLFMIMFDAISGERIAYATVSF